MKKVAILTSMLIVAALLVYNFYFKKDTTVVNEKEVPLNVNTNDSLTGNMGGALQAYFNLKDAFIQSDTALVNKAGIQFVEKINLVGMQDVTGDASIVSLAGQLKQTLANESNKLVAEKDMEIKRKSFQQVSDALFDMLRTIQYNGSTVYQQYCPMAFDNNGAAWLSNSNDIVNPYFGSKMLHCGELRDSIATAKN